MKNKHSAHDKFAGHRPGTPVWVHNNWHVSRNRVRFHSTWTYGWVLSRRYTEFGINKAEHHASSTGENLDRADIGKSSAP